MVLGAGLQKTSRYSADQLFNFALCKISPLAWTAQLLCYRQKNGSKSEEASRNNFEFDNFRHARIAANNVPGERFIYMRHRSALWCNETLFPSRWPVHSEHQILPWNIPETSRADGNWKLDTNALSDLFSGLLAPSSSLFTWLGPGKKAWVTGPMVDVAKMGQKVGGCFSLNFFSAREDTHHACMAILQIESAIFCLAEPLRI